MRVIVPTLPPSSLLSLQGDFASGSKFRETVVSDLKKAAKVMSRPPAWDERAIWQTDSVGRLKNLYPTPQEVAEFFGPLFSAAIVGNAPTLVVDVETSGDHQLASKLLCVGFGYESPEGPERILNVPFHQQHGARYWSPEHEEAVRYYVGAALAHVGITKCFHNGAFDTVVLWSHGFMVNGWRSDTMQAHHCIDSELPHNLGFVASRYLENRFWKDDVKGIGGWVDMDATTLRSYNLRDILVTSRIRPHLYAEITKQGLEDVYETELKCAQIMARATVRGVLIDTERRNSTKLDSKGKSVGLLPQLELQMATALADLRSVAGAGFDPMKPQQLRNLLFQQLKLPVVAETASGLPATGKEALMLLDVIADSDEQRRTLKNISLFRQAQKFKSTFVEGLTELGDGRFHPSWKLLTTSGRFGSSPNFQNLPKRIKRIFRAPPGRQLVGIDLSQAELRLIAFYANEPTLLEMYSKDINVHTVNATLLFRVRCPPEKKDHINPATENYLRHAVVKYLGLPVGAYDKMPVCPPKQWGSTRTLAKNAEFGQAYGAQVETVHSVLRSKRDPDSMELMFPTLALSEIQAINVLWRQKLRTGVVSFWGRIQEATKTAGLYRCPISGRIRRFRDGFKRNEMLNVPIQMGVASWMNECMVRIQDQFDAETGGDALIVQQVHDALTVDCDASYVQRAGQIMQETLSAPFKIHPDDQFVDAIGWHDHATLPADTPTSGTFLDEA